MLDTPMVKAGGDINPSRFVVLSEEHTVTEAGAAAANVLGVSHEGTKEAPQPNAGKMEFR